jgi:hypothetical protein
MEKRPMRYARLLLVTLIALSCFGGSFSCKSESNHSRVTTTTTN